ncbi:hypothetical protein TNCT_541821, partial [Trichonephila clavata]
DYCSLYTLWILIIPNTCTMKGILFLVLLVAVLAMGCYEKQYFEGMEF